MKSLLFIISLLMTFCCYGQDCPDIVKSVNEMKGYTIFVTPTIVDAPRIQVVKQIKETGDETSIIYFRIVDTKLRDNPKGVFVKFDNGEILRVENSLIRIEKQSSGDWSYWGAITFERSTYKQFSKYKIVNFVVDDGDNLVSPEWGEKIRNWVQCIYNEKI